VLQILTDQGRRQAWALGQSSDWTLGSNFWRIYASDLTRAQQTTQILLESIIHSNKVDPTVGASVVENKSDDLDDICMRYKVQWDSRLRELAKGARQGFPKSWTYQRALDERRRQLQEGTSTEPIPLLETEEEGETRIMEWLNELAEQAYNEYQTILSDANSTPGETRRNRFTVLAVAHSNIMRIFLKRLLGIDKLKSHPDALFDSNDGRFLIPNTSLTILDVRVARQHPETNPPRENPNWNTERMQLSTITGIDIVLLTSTKHYNLLEINQSQICSRSNQLFQEQS
jgi:broad specificity phosphatase PhoE